MTPKRKYWLLAANSKSDDMVNKVIRKKMKYCRIIGYSAEKKMKTTKKRERKSSHEEMKSKENSNRKKTSHKMEPMV
jgi:hypothetical protein